MKISKIQKKGIMGPIISVFVLVLIISILSGLTFLFVASLKTQAIDSSPRTVGTLTQETISAADLITGKAVAGVAYLDADTFVLTGVMNATDDSVLTITNATLTSAGVVTNSTDLTDLFEDGFEVNYTFSYIGAENENAYVAINTTENAGETVVGYLPLIFLAIIFGAILTLVLKIILPYINLGKQMGDGGF